MQGIESLNNFKKFVSSIGGLGRYEDTYIVHAAEGETVVPMEVLDRNPALKKRLFKTMMEMGIEPGRYIVGNELNSKNPVTGQPEFFLKKIVSQIRKALPGDTEQFLGPLVGLATGSLPLGAIAGAIGSGVPGAIAGGLGGLRSPGLDFFRQGTKTGFVDPLKFSELGNIDRLKEFFVGSGGKEGKAGILGKFDFTKATKTQSDKSLKEIAEQLAIDAGENKSYVNYIDEASALYDAESAVKSGMSIGDAARLFGLGTAGLGLLLKLTTEEQDVGLPIQELPEGNVIQSILDPKPIFAAEGGGVMDLRQGGESEGPGTGTSDDIPAMLSDGEFVMTAKAVRGAGGGDRREGAKKMYEAMDKLEAQA